LQGKTIDGHYPDYRSGKVIPDYQAENSTTFDADEIAELMQKLRVLNKIDGTSASIGVHIDGGFLVKKLHITPKIPFRVGFNEEYLAQMCSGEMRFKDTDSPFVITGQSGGLEKTSVIMPMKV
jgi:DNA polymerase III sliding clamp (beta) subunit (PCNA family)